MLRFVVLAAFLLATPAAAGTRNYSVGSFDRLRVDGPFRVVLTTGQPSGASAEGDPRITDTLDIHVEGDTLTVRAGANGWGEQPIAGDRGAPVIRLSTGMIRSAALAGGGALTISGPLKGQRIDLTLSGSGSVSAAGLDADQLFVTAVGSGSMTLGGRAAKVRLTTSGNVRMQAGQLVAGDLVLRTDGDGDMVAQARFTAAIATAGVGSVTVYGKPACTIRGIPAGPVSCGKAMPPPAR